MAHMLIRHKVADFARWKTAYDAHLAARQKAGLTEKNLWRNSQNANEVFVLFEAADAAKAKAFAESPDLKAAMQKAGVVDKPDLHLLQ